MAAVTTPLIQDHASAHCPATVSVIVCAHAEERWDDIARAITSLAQQSHAPDQVVLVIDHNDDLLERAANTYSGRFGESRQLRIDVVTNTDKQGLAGARDSGVVWCDGDVVAFLDNDASVANPNWIAMMLAAYVDSDVAGVGGGAMPIWSGTEQPEWFPSEFGWVVGCSYLGLPSEPAEVRNLIGCNMSFRREVFETIGGFSVGAERPERSPVRGRETEYCIRLHQRFPEARLVFDPRLDVVHRVSPDRREFRYFRSRCWAQGVAKALVARNVGSHDGLAAERTYARKVLPMGVARGIGEGLRGQSSGFRRAGAIVLGLMWATAGYARGRVARAAA